MESPINLYSYLDYRAYLRDVYNHLKSVKPQFSFRFFSKQAGFTSPNYLKMVMEGQRNLSQASIQKFRQGLKLNKDDGEFFENLVHYTQCKTLQEKNRYYDRLAASKHYLKTHKLEKASFDYLSHWYNLVIREMVSLKHFRADATWIACHLHPRITIAEAQTALELLQELGLLENVGGKLKKAKGNLATEREVHSLALSRIHKALMQKAMESLDRVPAKLRDIGSLTLAIQESKIPAVKEMIQNFRRQLHAFLQDDQAAEVVYQINLQLFPLTVSTKS